MLSGSRFAGAAAVADGFAVVGLGEHTGQGGHADAGSVAFAAALGDACGGPHFPSSQTRSPLQSMSLAQPAFEGAIALETLGALDMLATVETLAKPVAFAVPSLDCPHASNARDPHSETCGCGCNDRA